MIYDLSGMRGSFSGGGAGRQPPRQCFHILEATAGFLSFTEVNRTQLGRDEAYQQQSLMRGKHKPFSAIEISHFFLNQ